MTFEFYLIFESIPKMLAGLGITMELLFLSSFFGLCLGIILMLMRISGRWFLSFLAFMYIYFFRGTPLLVQTYLIYYGLGQFEWIRESVLWGPILSNAWWCALIAFTLNTAAYTTELFRGAIESTDRGEVEAAKACGLSGWMRMRRIILPSALRRALPAYSNEVIFMLHGSVVASTITIQDLLGVGRWLNGRYYLAYEGFITAALFYLVLVLLITRVFRYWEKNWLAHLYPVEAKKALKKKLFASIRF
jgi:arginine/ornithine transport system permease protein